VHIEFIERVTSSLANRGLFYY